MLGLTILNIEIVANTNGGKFSVSIPFKKGLNIIRAENSSGKSTCVNAIAYGLGLEAVLGPNARKRAFPKSLYEEIYDNKDEETPYFVSSSNVCIEVENSHGHIVTIRRDIFGDSNKVTVESKLENGDYFLGSSGKVGSANSEKGFHHWLANYIGWKLPSVVTFEGKETKLYLECIFPLFFIEQKRGWSEIQANTPTYYGIKNLKRSAVEFCLAIDSFEHEKKIAQLKNKIVTAESEWDKVISFSESIADFNSVKLMELGGLDLKKSSYSLDFSYLENDVYISINEQERSLNRLIEEKSREVASKEINNEELDAQLAVIRVLQRESEKNLNSMETLMLSISEVDKKLSVLRHDFDQYQQLKRLKNVGSDISPDIDNNNCPICGSDLDDTLGENTVEREPMTLEENIEFLKNQIDFFESIKSRTLHQLQETEAKGKLLKPRLYIENEKLKTLREDINDVNGATKSIIREKLLAQIQLRNVLKLKETRDDLNNEISGIYSRWETASNSLKQLRRKSTDTDKGLIINKLQSIIRGNLKAFNFKYSAINSVSVSKQTLRPEQEGYDIVAETSASDYIRIIWSYTLALLELAGNEKDIKHGGFIVFDEPRQHEASKFSFTNLIKKSSESDSYGGQVIFATSLDEAELKASCEGENVNLNCFDDYILSLEE